MSSLMSTSDLDYAAWKQSISKHLRKDVTENFATQSYPESDKDFMANTDLLGQLNASGNAYGYLAEAVGGEQARMAGLDRTANRDIYRLRSETMHADRGKSLCDFLSFIVRVVLFASMLVVAVVLAARTGTVGTRTATILTVAVMAVAGAVIALNIGYTAGRRNDVWGHFYWVAGAEPQNATNDTSN